MFKNLKSVFIPVLILILLVLTFFVFYVPGDSAEGRVSRLNQFFARKELADISFELLEYLENFSPEERAEIFNNIPFTFVKDNPELLISVFDESYPEWKKLNSFNSNYLMTEVEIIAKQNTSPIKNTDPVSLKRSYSDLRTMDTDIKSVFTKVWDIDDRSVFVVDGTLKCEMNLGKDENRVLHFEVELFDIKTGYVFHAGYSGDNLVIKPENRKTEDTGAFELSEKIGVYDYNRLKNFISGHYKINFDSYSLIFDDSYIDKKLSRDDETAGADIASGDRHLDVIIYSDLIRVLDLSKDKNVSYAGSMRFRPLNVRTQTRKAEENEAENENETYTTVPAAAKGLDKEISLNIFKADW